MERKPTIRPLRVRPGYPSRPQTDIFPLWPLWREENRHRLNALVLRASGPSVSTRYRALEQYGVSACYAEVLR